MGRSIFRASAGLGDQSLATHLSDIILRVIH
jgi:hypothetical protein